MSLSAKSLHIYPMNRHPRKTIDNITLQLQTMNISTQKLDQVEASLNNFNAETAYTNIHSRLTEKYNELKSYYKSIEGLRKRLDDDGKEKLVKELDQIVSLLTKDFTICSEEKYILLDEIFLIRTNSHVNYDLDKLATMADLVIANPGKILEDELEKMEKIQAILENERKRLQGIEELRTL